jgi:hypothetical protein
MEGSAQYIIYRFEHDVTGGSYVGWLNWTAQQRRTFKGTLADMETRNEMNQHKIGYEIGAYAVHQLTQKNALRPSPSIGAR